MIKVITFQDIQPLYKEAKKHQLLMSDKLTYFGWYEQDKLVAFVGYKLNRNIVILDCDYCKEEYRGKGIYTKLHKFRMDYIREKEDKKIARITCTKYSKGLHKKLGAELIHIYKVSKWEKYEYKL